MNDKYVTIRIRLTKENAKYLENKTAEQKKKYIMELINNSMKEEIKES